MRPVSLYCNTSDFGSQKQGSATARHKRFKMTKITVFPECQTTGCHFSKWRAVGGQSRKHLTYSLFSTARHFPLWRAVPISRNLLKSYSAFSTAARTFLTSSLSKSLG
jgi:hypothetical protein